MDPYYDGSTAEATAWGQRQAKRAVALLADHANFDNNILVIDVEAANKGWKDRLVPGSCGSVQTYSCCSTALNRAVVQGFRDWVWANTPDWPAIYASPSTWNSFMGTGSDGDITNTMEWVADYASTTNCAQPAPHGWSQASPCGNSPSFFGGIGTGSDCALMWQWFGGKYASGTKNGDFNQVDTNREFLCK